MKLDVLRKLVFVLVFAYFISLGDVASTNHHKQRYSPARGTDNARTLSGHHFQGSKEKYASAADQSGSVVLESADVWRQWGRISAVAIMKNLRLSYYGRHTCQWTESSSDGTVVDLPSKLRPPQENDPFTYCVTTNSPGISDVRNSELTYRVTLLPDNLSWTAPDRPINIYMESCPLVAVENRPRAVTCHLSDPDLLVWWDFYNEPEGPQRSIGTCFPSSACLKTRSCCGFGITLSRPSDRVSTVTFSRVTRSVFRDFRLSCRTLRFGVGITDGCPMDVVVPAVVSPPRLTVNLAAWKIQGSAVVTRVYSSMGRYSCQWTEAGPTGASRTLPGNLVLNPDPANKANTQDRRGLCFLSSALPGASGPYTYTVAVSPVNTRVTSRPVVVILS